MGDVTKEKHFQLEVVKWEGRLHCCYLNNFRIAGGKPWAGGETVKAWSVPLRDVIKAIPELQKMSSDFDAALAREAALREELADAYTELRNRCSIIAANVNERDNLAIRLTAAEQRNAELLERAKELTIWMHAEWGNTEIHPDCIRDLAVLNPKPIESGASE
jgi:hypothetical protein